MPADALAPKVASASAGMVLAVLDRPHVLVFQSLLYPRPTKLEGGYTGFTLSVRLSVRPSVRLSVDDMVSGA